MLDGCWCVQVYIDCYWTSEYSERAGCQIRSHNKTAGFTKMFLCTQNMLLYLIVVFVS